MKLSQLKNGYVVVKASSKDDYRYVMPSDTNALGVAWNGALVAAGVVQVYVYGTVQYNQPVRARAQGDGGLPGMAVGVTAGYSTAYLQIGVALESGRDKLISVALNIRYMTAASLSGILGSGTANRITRFTDATTIGDSGLVDDGTNISTSENIRLQSDSRKYHAGAGNDMTMWYDGTDANIKTDDVAPSDLQIHTGANKTVELQTVVWDDLRITPGAFDYAGTGDPSLVDWQPGGSGATFKVYAFTSGAAAYFTVQLPHSYKQGENIYVHCHWTPKDRGNEENARTVAWKLDYSWANINGVFGASATADMTDACNGVDHEHNMTPEAEILGSGKNISSMLVCRVYRDAGDSWVGTIAAQSPVLLEVDFHFPSETLGSRQRSTK